MDLNITESHPTSQLEDGEILENEAAAKSSNSEYNDLKKSDVCGHGKRENKRITKAKPRKNAARKNKAISKPRVVPRAMSKQKRNH